MGIVETHCHLHYEPARAGELIARAKDAGVDLLITVGVDADSNEKIEKLADDHDDLYFAPGIHPHEASTWNAEQQVALTKHLSHGKAVALGETGLDFYYTRSPRDAQFTAFREQARLAKRLGKPLIIHCRDAKDEVAQVLKEEGPFPKRGIIHCFTEDMPFAKTAMDQGFLISFSGIVTFKNTDVLRDVARHMPLESMVIETDSPYLAPVPYRGKPNEPSYIVEVAKLIADLRKVPLHMIVDQTSANARSLFGLASR
jgi:TatD DNase family protein